MNIKEFMVNLYDLIANNTSYQPRQKLDSILSKDIEDYCLDCERDPSIEAHIMFRANNGKQYKLTLTECEE